MTEAHLKICLDANLWVKFFVPEKQSEMIARLMAQWLEKDAVFLAPSHLLFEFASTLRKKEKMKLIREGDGPVAIRLFYEFPLLLYQSEDYLEETWGLAKKMGETVLYDVGYLALAMWQNVPFYTADARFFKKAKKFYSEAFLLGADAA